MGGGALPNQQGTITTPMIDHLTGDQWQQFERQGYLRLGQLQMIPTYLSYSSGLKTL